MPASFAHAPPANEPMPPDVQFRPVGGGERPAREMPARGPTQNEHLMASFEDPLAAADRVDLRSAMQAQREADEYGIQADKALAREEAADKALMQRQAQLERLQMDYEDEVQKLGQFKFDDKRYWKKQDAGDLIGASLLMLFGGLGQASGAGNIGFQYIMKQIDDDLEAQKFDYMVQQDKAKGAHNAFAQAMDRFGSEDAAAGVARAASIDATMQKINQVQAQWKGVDASNAADMLRAQLMSERERTIAAGIKFVPSQVVGGKYKMFVRGQEVPGLVGEHEAQRIALEHGVKPAESADLKVVEGEIQARLEGIKAGAKANEDAVKARGLVVPPMTVGNTQIPGYNAATVDEAKGDREAREAGARLVDMIDQVLAKRAKEGYTGRTASALTPINFKWENEVRGLAPQIGVEWSKTKKLGTYDRGVEALIGQIQGDPTSIGESADEKLKQLRASVLNGLAVSKETQTGESRKPSTFVGYGGKK
jgi:hypothetical protein